MQKHKILKLLGYGSDGVVYKVRDETSNAEYAIKEGPPFPDDLLPVVDDGLPQEFVRELTNLKALTPHPCIVSLIGIQRKAHPTIRGFDLVLELMDMDLDKYITGQGVRQIPINIVKNILYQILLGVEHCHKNGIMHRDLKPSNVMINPKSVTVKIADFGVARSVVQTIGNYSPPVTTKRYTAPEILPCGEGGSPYSFAADMWSVGCIFVELVLKRHAFPQDDALTLNDLICRASSISQDEVFREALSCFLDASGLNLLFHMLEFEPSKRISATDALNHSFFAKMDKSVYGVRT